MLRKLFLLCTSLAAAAVGVFLWKKRDELEAEIERIRGERRAGLRSAPSPRHGAPRTNGASRIDGAVTTSPGRAPTASRVTPGDTGAVRPPAGSAEAREPGEPEPRVEPLGAGAEARCQADTRSGKRCTRPPEPGSDYCWQHAPS